MNYIRGYPATVNDAIETEEAAAVAAEVVGKKGVVRDCDVTMGAEDFSYMLNEVKGCYIWLGQGAGGEEGVGVGSDPNRDYTCMVHNPNYDFNDAVLPYGADFFVRMVQRKLMKK